MASYISIKDFDPNLVEVTTIHARNGRENIYMSYGAQHKALCFITPVCETRYPRCHGDGNLNTAFGPTDPLKAQFTLDLHDPQTSTFPDFEDWDTFMGVLDALDDKLLHFVYKNQQRLLNRRNLTMDELKMLQIRSAKRKVDKWSGELQSPTVSLTARKFYKDQCWNDREKTICLYDNQGNQLHEPAKVMPGDLVSATIQADNVYSGVGGDKFGIHWTFHDVCIVCQSDKKAGDSPAEAFKAQFQSHPVGQSFENFSAEV